MAKILDVINLAQYHKWPKPIYSPKVWHQHIKNSAQLYVIEAQETREVTQKSDIYASQMQLLGGAPHIYEFLSTPLPELIQDCLVAWNAIKFE